MPYLSVEKKTIQLHAGISKFEDVFLGFEKNQQVCYF